MSRFSAIERAIAAGLAGGLLLWLASPTIGVGSLAWLALVAPAAVAIADPAGRAGRLAVPVAYVLALELLLVPALPFGLAEGQYGGLPAPLMVAESPVLLVALVLVPLFGLFLWSVRFGQPWPAAARHGAVLVVVPAFAWAGLDFLRVKLDPGAFWGPLFLSQHDLPTASLAALGGPAVVTFAIALVGYALALATVRRTRTAAAAAAALVAAVAAAAFAADRIRGEGGRAVTVAAVQPGEHTAADDRFPFERFHPGTHDLAAADVISDLAPLTREAAARGAQLVVWPEAMAYVDPTSVEPARSDLLRLARTSATTIVVPYFVRARRQGEAVIVSPTGAISRRLPKQRPSWFWKEDGGNRMAPSPVEVAGISIGTLLGVDNGDPAVARRLADAGADVIASATHDWRELAEPQLALSRIAATALGVPIVRADWRYGSAVIDADGSDAAAPGTGRARRIVVAEVRTRSGSTPYAAVGDAFGWLCAAVAVALWLALPFTALRRRAAPRPAPAEPRPARPASPPRP